MKRIIFALLLVFFMAGGVWGDVKRIGIVTDTRYKRTEYPGRADIAEEIVSRFNFHNVNLVLHLGDAYEGSFTDQEDFLADKEIYEQKWEGITVPMYWVIGDYDRWGIPPPYYVANSTYCPELNFTADLPDSDWRFICYSNVSSGRTANEDTLIWLQEALESARLQEKKIIVCTHCRIDQDYSEENAFPFSYNADEQRTKINIAVTAGADVKYVFQGHHKTNAYAVVEGIGYYTFKNADDTGACAIVEIQDDDSLVIMGYNDQESYNVSNFYVDGENGNDENSGVTRDQAWKTLDKANIQIDNGQTVTVLPFIYRESLKPRGGAEGVFKKWIFESGCKISGADKFSNWSKQPDGNGWFAIGNVTTEVKMLIEDNVKLSEGDYASEAATGMWDWNDSTLYYCPSAGTPESHTVEGGQRDWVFGADNKTQYLTVEGGGVVLYGSNKNGIYLNGGDSSVTISNFVSKNNAESGIRAPSPDWPCGIKFSRFVIQNNNHGVYFSGISSPILSYGVITHNADSGIVIMGDSEAELYNLVSAFNHRGINLQNTGGNVTMKNIILASNSYYNFRAQNDGDRQISDSYIPSSPEIEWGNNTVYETISSDDPLFVNPDSGDFRLQSSSPCIDTGLTIAGIHDQPGFVDLAGKPLLNEPDIGAYEYHPPALGLADVIVALKIVSGWDISQSFDDIDGDKKIGLEEAISILYDLSVAR